MANLSFEQFNKIMNELVNKRHEREKWLDNLDKVLPNSFETILQYDFFPEAIKMLEMAMNDRDGWIDYFFYECECKPFTYEYEGKEYMICDNRDFYDLLTGNSRGFEVTE